MRIQTSINVSKPLLRREKLNLGFLDSAWVSFSYECLSNLYYYCRRLGHTNKDYIVWIQEKELFDLEGLPYGIWMKADSHGPLPKTMPTGQVPGAKAQTSTSTVTSKNPKTILTNALPKAETRQGFFNEAEKSHRLFHEKRKIRFKIASS